MPTQNDGWRPVDQRYIGRIIKALTNCSFCYSIELIEINFEIKQLANSYKSIDNSYI